jgi:hypothetical protein
LVKLRRRFLEALVLLPVGEMVRGERRFQMRRTARLKGRVLTAELGLMESRAFFPGEIYWSSETTA